MADRRERFVERRQHGRHALHCGISNVANIVASDDHILTVAENRNMSREDGVEIVLQDLVEEREVAVEFRGRSEVTVRNLAWRDRVDGDDELLARQVDNRVGVLRMEMGRFDLDDLPPERERICALEGRIGLENAWLIRSLDGPGNVE